MRLILALAGAMLISAALADDDAVPVPCLPLSSMKDPSKFRPATHDEWIALRTAFFILPGTPLAFPPGDKAIIREDGDGSGEVLFVDGDEGCGLMKLREDGLKMLKALRDGKITHAEGRM